MYCTALPQALQCQPVAVPGQAAPACSTDSPCLTLETVLQMLGAFSLCRRLEEADRRMKSTTTGMICKGARTASTREPPSMPQTCCGELRASFHDSCGKGPGLKLSHGLLMTSTTEASASSLKEWALNKKNGRSEAGTLYSDKKQKRQGQEASINSKRASTWNSRERSIDAKGSMPSCHGLHMAPRILQQQNITEDKRTWLLRLE